MIILGIDPGSRFTGFGVIKATKSQVEHLDNGVIVLTTQKTFSARLLLLYHELHRVISLFTPDILALENVFYHKNVKSLQKLGEARGVVLLCAALTGTALCEYTPLEVKKNVVGYGQATKQQMQYMIRKILKLKEYITEDASDALGIALCHASVSNRLTRLTQDTRLTSNKTKELLKQASFYR